MKPILTSDKSHTLFNEIIGEHYHSTFGAKQESEHIFINAGLAYLSSERSEIKILEIGFGTGLNALLAYKFGMEHNIKIEYFSIEPFPIDEHKAKTLNYPELLEIPQKQFMKMHEQTEAAILIDANFTLKKSLKKLEETELAIDKYNLVFFDAFSPEAQPELWTEEVFGKIFSSMKEGGILTTYSCKGIVKRALRAVGFKIKRLPGPPGKRQFLRAEKKDEK